MGGMVRYPGDSLFLAHADFGSRVDDLELSDVHPKKAFITGAIEKEIRLSFAGRIKGTLPEQYQYIFTEKKMKDIPDFKYDKESECIHPRNWN